MSKKKKSNIRNSRTRSSTAKSSSSTSRITQILTKCSTFICSSTLSSSINFRTHLSCTFSISRFILSLLFFLSLLILISASDSNNIVTSAGGLISPNPQPHLHLNHSNCDNNDNTIHHNCSISLPTITTTTNSSIIDNSSINNNFVNNNNHKFHYNNYQQDLEDYEDPEEDFRILSAIAESIREWQLKREQKRSKQYEKEQQEQEDSPEFSSKDPNRSKSRKRRDEESVCYRHFGCFRDEGPFDYLDTLPASPESIGTYFMLYTRKNLKSLDPKENLTEGHIIDYENTTTLLVSNFNSSNNVKIIIHGFGSSSKRPWVTEMAKHLLIMSDFNVITVDWENGSKMPNYVQAAANTQLIGKQIAKLMHMINYHTKLTPTHYHLIGFSLGAHVAGFTGMEIRNISRITGLDPASPLFEGYPARVRLDPTDANFVDVIHSNGDGFIRGGLGSYAPMGHVDFYPNGGRVQVGCNSVIMGAITDIISGKWNSLCNHRRAFKFFIDSVKRTCTFPAFACESYEDFLRGDCFSCGPEGKHCSNMGYYAYHSHGRGNMYLMTREKEPFCVNQFRIRIESSRDGQMVTWGKIDITFKRNEIEETFVISQDSDEIKEGGQVQALVVAHPNITNFSEVTLTYTKYKGWIYNGKNEWGIDRIEVVDSAGNVKSYCNPGTKLLTTVKFQVPLTPGNCTIPGTIILPVNVPESNSVATVSVPSHASPDQVPYHLVPSQPPSIPYHSPGQLYPPPNRVSNPFPPQYGNAHLQPQPPYGQPISVHPGPGYTVIKPTVDVELIQQSVNNNNNNQPSGSENDIDTGGNSGPTGGGGNQNSENVSQLFWKFFGYEESANGNDKRKLIPVVVRNTTEVDQSLLENHVGSSPRPNGPRISVPLYEEMQQNSNSGEIQGSSSSSSSSSSPSQENSSSSSSSSEDGSKPNQNGDFNEGSNLLRSSDDDVEEIILPVLANDNNNSGNNNNNNPKVSKTPKRQHESRHRKWSNNAPNNAFVNRNHANVVASLQHHPHIRSIRMLPYSPQFGGQLRQHLQKVSPQHPQQTTAIILINPIDPIDAQQQSQQPDPESTSKPARWTRASNYLRNRTAQLFMRFLSSNNQQTPVPKVPQPHTTHAHPKMNSLNPSIQNQDQDGMDLLTDYSNLAYYILTNPQTGTMVQAELQPHPDSIQVVVQPNHHQGSVIDSTGAVTPTGIQLNPEGAEFQRYSGNPQPPDTDHQQQSVQQSQQQQQQQNQQNPQNTQNSNTFTRI